MPRFGFGYIGAYTNARGITPFDRFNMGGSGLSGVNQSPLFPIFQFLLFFLPSLQLAIKLPRVRSSYVEVKISDERHKAKGIASNF